MKSNQPRKCSETVFRLPMVNPNLLDGVEVFSPLAMFRLPDGNFAITDRAALCGSDAEAVYEQQWLMDYRDQGGMMFAVKIYWQHELCGEQHCPDEWDYEIMVLADNPLEALRLARLSVTEKHEGWMPFAYMQTKKPPEFNPGGRMANVYRGIRCDDCHVFVTKNGCRLKHNRSCKVFNHSPDGFNWGYGGSGPAQLALAILLEEGLTEDEACRWHQTYKSEVISRLPRDGWQITTYDVLDFLTRNNAE